jgi:hypothetical protein
LRETIARAASSRGRRRASGARIQPACDPASVYALQ